MLNWKYLIIGAAVLLVMAIEIVLHEGWLAARAHWVGVSILMWVSVAAQKAKYPHPVSYEREALSRIVQRLGDEQLSSLGREIRDMALKGLGHKSV